MAALSDSADIEVGLSGAWNGEVEHDDVIGEDGDVSGVDGGDRGGEVLGEGSHGLVRILLLALGMVL